MTLDLLERPAALFPIEDVTRREFLAGGAAAGALLVLGSTGVGLPADASTSAWSFTDDLGRRVTASKRPVRVAALDDATAVTLSSVGVHVVATPMVSGTVQLLQQAGASARQIAKIVGYAKGQTEDIEALAAARPDLLVGNVYTNWQQIGGVDVTSIAPAAGIEFQTTPFSHQMTTVHRLATDLGIRITDRIAQHRYQTEATALRNALAKKRGLRVAFCFANTSGLELNVPAQWGFMRTLEELGMHFVPTPSAGANAYFEAVSWEDVPNLPADLILFWSSPIPTNPAWAAMPAVKAGHVLDTGQAWQLRSYENYAALFARVVSAVEKATPGIGPK